MESNLIPISLIERSKTGDKVAQSDLGKALHELICQFLRRRGVQSQDADALSVECADEILRSLQRFQSDSGSLESWAIGFAIKRHFRFSRDQRIRSEREAPFEESLHQTSTSEDWTEQFEVMDSVLAELDPLTLEILRLKFAEQKRSDEIGAELHLSAEAVRKRLSRTGERLRNEPRLRRFYLS